MDFPITVKVVIFHCYVSSPEGKSSESQAFSQPLVRQCSTPPLVAAWRLRPRRRPLLVDRFSGDFPREWVKHMLKSIHGNHIWGWTSRIYHSYFGANQRVPGSQALTHTYFFSAWHGWEGVKLWLILNIFSGLQWVHSSPSGRCFLVKGRGCTF